MPLQEQGLVEKALHSNSKAFHLMVYFNHAPLPTLRKANGTTILRIINHQ